MNHKINEKKIEKILIQLLNGHNDLCQKIIQFKNDLEIEDIKKEIIERDFYNWLNHDLVIRSKILKNSYYGIYYLMNSNNLGLIFDEKGFRRNKSLTECFQLKWWKTTQKKNNRWQNIHLRINLMKTMKIWKYEHDLIPGWIFDSFDDFINNDWMIPTIHECNAVFKLIGDDNISEVNGMYYLANDFIVYFS